MGRSQRLPSCQSQTRGRCRQTLGKIQESTFRERFVIATEGGKVIFVVQSHSSHTLRRNRGEEEHFSISHEYL